MLNIKDAVSFNYFFIPIFTHVFGIVLSKLITSNLIEKISNNYKK